LHKRDTIPVVHSKPKSKNTMKHFALKSLSVKAKATGLFVVALLLVATSVIPNFLQQAQAATCGTIAECQAQIETNNNIVAQLRAEATSFQDAVNRLNAQIVQLQGAIDASTAQQADLQKQIEAAQAEIARQKAMLASDVKAMYIDGTPSTLEVLATSRDLSEFVDKQEYRTRVQSKLQETLQKIAELQRQLQDQKLQVEALLKQQNEQKVQLAAAYSEQANLLAFNQSQQASYNAQTAQNESKLAELIAAQRRANSGPLNGNYYLIRFPGNVGGFNGAAYPFNNAGFSMSTAPGCGHPDPNTGQRDAYDGWGYCTRQCVSYAAWAVGASGRSIPTNLGNANNWPSGVPASWLHTSGAKVGDVLVSMSGRWGHVMYVEQVDGNKVRVSEYNQQLDGRYQNFRWVTLN
jgi:peptidoglycan hydrolase CwlO-like protein